MAGTFQDRLVSELRLARATTIDQANAVLGDFLPRFNQQFRVPAQQAQIAYRSLDSSIFLERVLCFKHTRQVARDNTVKFQWRTLQLLPSEERPSYAGAKVEVLEQSNGQLMVQHNGEVIALQESSAQARRPESFQRRSGAHPGDGPGGQEPGAARPLQIATSAPGHPGSRRPPAPEGC